MKKNRFDSLWGRRETDSQAIWVTCYSDMMTSLMVFFLILWAYTQLSRAKPVPSSQTLPAPNAIRQEIMENIGEVGAVVMSPKKLTLTLPAAVLFGPGSADLNPAARQTLAKVGFALSKSTSPIVVEGHTDDAPIQLSKWRSNYQLSAARAFSVIQFFTAFSNIPPHRLAARGYGPFRPVVPNDSPQNKTQNRRIEIQLWAASS